jgi:DNA-directed RNA polymerase specialized sigma24 family protein
VRPHINDQVIGERRHLLSLAFRMLGTFAEAEDAVQETYARWYRLAQPQRDAIEVPRAWLTRVAGRICLDVLDSARVRRERYVGPWLPEPLPSEEWVRNNSADPLDRITLYDSISTALLVVLESMTPAERVTFVLHDVVRAFAVASLSGRFEQLIAVLDPDVVLRSDGGGIVSAARKPVFGAGRVARFLLGIIEKRPEVTVSELQTNDGLAFAMWEAGRVVGIINLGVTGNRISDVWMVLNPEKLSQWI